MIKLDQHWHIDTSGSSATLIFEKEGELNPKTQKPIQRKEVFYYSTVKQALTGYANRSLIHSESIEEILDKLDKIETVIKNLKL